MSDQPAPVFTHEELNSLYVAADRACELDMGMDDPPLETACAKLVAYVYGSEPQSGGDEESS